MILLRQLYSIFRIQNGAEAQKSESIRYFIQNLGLRFPERQIDMKFHIHSVNNAEIAPLYSVFRIHFCLWASGIQEMNI